METVRHLALGCCILSAVAGVIRTFWPENGFAPVINAVLALYIVSAGLQMVRGTDWSALVTQLYELSGTTQTDTQEYAEYGRFLGTTASIQAVQQVLANAGIQASAQWEGDICKIRLFHASDRTRAESILAESCGELPYEIESGGDTP